MQDHDRRWRKVRRLSKIQPYEMGAVRYGANHRTFAVRKEDEMLQLPSLETVLKAHTGLSEIVEVLKAGKPLDAAASKVLTEKLDVIADLIMPPADPVQPASGTLQEIVGKVRKDLEALSTQAMVSDYVLSDHVDAVLEQVKQAEALLPAEPAEPAAAAAAADPSPSAPTADVQPTAPAAEFAPPPAVAPAPDAPAPDAPAPDAPAPAAEAVAAPAPASEPVAAAATVEPAAAPAPVEAAPAAPTADAGPAEVSAPEAPAKTTKTDMGPMPILVAKDMGLAGIAVEDALMGISQAVRDYWEGKTPKDADGWAPRPWVRATYKDRVVVEHQGKFWQQSWVYAEGKYAVGEPVEVIQTYVAVSPPADASVIKSEPEFVWMPAPAEPAAAPAVDGASAAPAPATAAKASASDDEKKRMTKEDVQAIVAAANSGIAESITALKGMIEGLKAAPPAPVVPAPVAKTAGTMPALSGQTPQATQAKPAAPRANADAAISAIEHMDLTMSPDLARINDYGVLEPFKA